MSEGNGMTEDDPNVEVADLHDRIEAIQLKLDKAEELNKDPGVADLLAGIQEDFEDLAAHLAENEPTDEDEEDDDPGEEIEPDVDDGQTAV